MSTALFRVSFKCKYKLVDWAAPWGIIKYYGLHNMTLP